MLDAKGVLDVDFNLAIDYKLDLRASLAASDQMGAFLVDLFEHVELNFAVEQFMLVNFACRERGMCFAPIASFAAILLVFIIKVIDLF